MACFHPLSGWRDRGGGITFNRSRAYVDLPVTVACGQCRGCRQERARQWAVRCGHEASQHEASCFVTLTYSPEHLPEDWSLNHRHWQLFMKRLRKRLGPIRFMMCGEYGEENSRPHYHAVLFGTDFAFDRYPGRQSRKGHVLYESPTLEKAWKLGYCSIGEFTYESARYVAGYVLKKVNGDRQEAHYELVDGETGEVHSRRPAYATMSRRPGLGQRWFERYSEDVYPDDEVISNGKPARPPRYYDGLLEKKDPAVLERVKAERRARGSKHEANNTRERLDVREELLERKLRRSEREV